MLQLVTRFGTCQNGPHPKWSERGNILTLYPGLMYYNKGKLGNERKFHTRGDRNGEVELDAFNSHESWGMTLELG